MVLLVFCLDTSLEEGKDKGICALPFFCVHPRLVCGSGLESELVKIALFTHLVVLGNKEPKFPGMEFFVVVFRHVSLIYLSRPGRTKMYWSF